MVKSVVAVSDSKFNFVLGTVKNKKVFFFWCLFDSVHLVLMKDFLFISRLVWLLRKPWGCFLHRGERQHKRLYYDKSNTAAMFLYQFWHCWKRWISGDWLFTLRWFCPFVSGCYCRSRWNTDVFWNKKRRSCGGWFFYICIKIFSYLSVL